MLVTNAVQIGGVYKSFPQHFFSRIISKEDSIEQVQKLAYIFLGLTPTTFLSARILIPFFKQY